MTGKHPTILITDDARVNREVVRRCLERHGYQFCEAENGAEALDTIRTQAIDLVILDLIMPIMDGFALLKRLKADPLHASIPVIVNSSREDNASIQEALSLGGYDYFYKTLPRDRLEFLLPLKARNAIQSKRLLDEVVAQKRVLEREIRAAGRYQRFLLPHEVCAPGMAIETIFHPYIGVGGDFFDFVPLAGGQTGMIIADVSGHGVLPAMITSILKPLFSKYIVDTESPCDTLKLLNADFLKLTDEADYITAFVAIFDPRSRRLRYANAGHPPSFHLRHATGIIDILRATGVFLGVFGSDEWSVEERDVGTMPGDRLLLFTDGMSEARSETGTHFGIMGLETVLRDAANSGLQHMSEVVWQRLRAFTGDRFTDDITCIAIEFTSETG